MNDRKIADAVNEIRDMAVKYRDTQQLRDRIASLMTTILRAQDVARAPLTDEQRIAIQECIGYLTPAAKEFSDLGLPGMGDSKHARCIRTLRSILAPAAPAVAPEGCTPADAQMLRAANHQLAAENDYLRRRLRPFAQLASSPLSWAIVEYCIDGDPEKQTLQAPQMQRAFNRAADALHEDVAGQEEESTGICLFCGSAIDGKHEDDCPQADAAPAQAEQQGDDSLAFKYGNAIVDRKLDPSYEQQSDGDGKQERRLIGYDECRCILTQYCDGTCRPIFASIAAEQQGDGGANQCDYLDTLTAVLNVIGYTEEFAARHPDLKVSEGVKLFLAIQRGAIDCQAHIGPDCTECGGTGFWENEKSSARVALSDEQIRRALKVWYGPRRADCLSLEDHMRDAILAASAAQGGGDD